MTKQEKLLECEAVRISCINAMNCIREVRWKMNGEFNKSIDRALLSLISVSHQSVCVMEKLSPSKKRK